MTIYFYIFLASFVTIMVMFGRRLMVLRNKGLVVTEEEYVEVRLEIPYLNEVKEVTVRKVKRIGYMGLVTTIRFYFRSSNMVKSGYRELVEKMKSVKNHEVLNGAIGQEASGFLKVVSDYKTKIRRIKHQIKKEENIL